MAYTDPGRGGWSSGGAEIRPHAYDPYQQPELFRGVLTRR
ncbi:MAG: RDD family protein, partial [Bradyrhizobium sp.]|nr:RDD family protein [Bradyrhizobium sp.]